MRIGISGDEGSFSEQAAKRYTAKANITAQFVYLIDMENVLAALQAEKIDLGIFPVVNLQGGLVKMAFTAMGKYFFQFIDEFWMEINQCLLAKSGTIHQSINKIVSHPQGLAQCKGYLQNHFPDATLQTWEDTAKAARDLADGILETNVAVIAPENCAKLYGLTLLEKGIEDSKPNLTAFIVVRGNHAND